LEKKKHKIAICFYKLFSIFSCPNFKQCFFTHISAFYIVKDSALLNLNIGNIITVGYSANQGSLSPLSFIFSHLTTELQLQLLSKSMKPLILTLTVLTYQLLFNGTAHFKNCKQLLECQHLLLLRDIWWPKF
jgi:hypothetical protein